MKETILANLSQDYPWTDRIQYFDTIDSTNTRLKLLAQAGAPEGTALIADCQTGGRGRLGRSFQSPAGTGIYLSLLLRPDCVPQELMHLTCAVGTAMCNAAERASGLRPSIKWTNDLVYKKRKLAGILVELAMTAQGRIAYAVIGIGVNCNQCLADFPQELQAVAGSLAMAAGKPIDRAALAAAMLEELAKMNRRLLTDKAGLMAQYRADCMTLHQEVSIVRGDEVYRAYAEDIDSDGGLIVRFPDGQRKTVASGEVSVRGLYGYV